MSPIFEEKMLIILTDIRSYLRTTAAASSRSAAQRVIDSQEKAVAYSKMDGKTSTYAIADATGVPPRTVANWAEDFVHAGLTSPPGELFPSHRALFSLNELSVNLTILKARKKKKETPSSSSSQLQNTTLTNQTTGGNTNG
jgi:hypothetical protein